MTPIEQFELIISRFYPGFTIPERRTQRHEATKDGAMIDRYLCRLSPGDQLKIIEWKSMMKLEGPQTVSDWIHLRDRDKDIIGIVRLADVSAIHFGHPAAKTEQEQQISIAPLMEIPA